MRIVENLLVYPKHELSPQKILSFKRKHGEQLIKFRKEIESFLNELEKYPTQGSDNKINEFIAYAEEERDRIASNMKSANMLSLQTSNLIALLKPSIELTDSIISKRYEETATSFAEIVHVAYKTSNKIKKIKKAEMAKPLAYAATFNKAFTTYEFPSKKLFSLVH